MAGPESPALTEIEVHIRLRRLILEKLYRIFREQPYSAVELQAIADECNTDPATLNWNLVYLEKCGYLELGRSYDCAPYIAPFAALTASGIDLIEDGRGFEERFPSGAGRG